MNSYKQTIDVSSVVPNDGNPRKDFGDVEALAASMSTNGGEPFSPIIVVPDGSQYRLVDGERRWRAMVSLGTERCDALVFPSMGEAETAVAMMATDHAKSLDARERLRGFQSMIALGVDDDGVAAVADLDADTVRRVRRFARDLPEQATLDGLIAAAHDEFSDDERAEIIGEGTRAYGDPQRTADRIRRRHERDAKMAAIRDSLPESVEYRDGGKPWDPARAGLVYLTTARSEGAAEKFAAEWNANPELVAFEDGIAYAIYRKVADGEVSEREQAEAEERRIRDEHKAAYDTAFHELSAWATKPWWSDDLASRMAGRAGRTPASRRPNLCEAIVNGRKGASWLYSVLSDEARKAMSPAVSFAEDEDPSCLEVCHWLWEIEGNYGLMTWTGTEYSESSCRKFANLCDLLVMDGIELSEETKAIYDIASEKVADESDPSDD